MKKCKHNENLDLNTTCKSVENKINTTQFQKLYPEIVDANLWKGRCSLKINALKCEHF